MDGICVSRLAFDVVGIVVVWWKMPFRRRARQDGRVAVLVADRNGCPAHQALGYVGIAVVGNYREGEYDVGVAVAVERAFDDEFRFGIVDTVVASGEAYYGGAEQGGNCVSGYCV